MITDVIRNADSEHEVFVLLSAYVGSTHVDSTFQCLSECANELPLQDTVEIQARLGQLMHELDSASRNLDDHACLVLREAVHVFGTSLNRLVSLEKRQRSQLAA